MRNKRRTVSGGYCGDPDGRSPAVLPACRGAGQVRSLDAVPSCDSNIVVDSYLVELRNIAINFRSLGPITRARLKEAETLIASRRTPRQEANKITDQGRNDEEGRDLEYNLLPPSQVAIVDDMIAYQQFGEYIFCAPQETILEGECGTVYP